MGCNCKCGCCAVCSYSICYGTCCVCPPATCGCGNDCLTDDVCLNTTYYMYGDGTYYSFQFSYVMLVTEVNGASTEDTIETFMVWYYDIPNGYAISTNYSDVPSGSVLSNGTCQDYAQNCYMWQTELYNSLNSGTAVFTSYAISGCTSKYPTGECIF